MKKLIVITLIFMAGHFYGNTVINTAKTMYDITVQKVQDARH